MKKTQPHPNSIYDQFLKSSRKTGPHPEIPQKEPSITKIETFLAVLHGQILAGTLNISHSAVEKPLTKLLTGKMDYKTARHGMRQAINELLREEDPWDPETIET